MLEGDATRIQHLRNTNREFATLERRHRELDDLLDELARRRMLTPDEEMHRKTIQKRKLATKDRMYALMRLSVTLPSAPLDHLSGRPQPCPPPHRGRSRWMDAFMSRSEPAADHH